GRHWSAIGVPEGRTHHVLDAASLSVSQLDLHSLPLLVLRPFFLDFRVSLLWLPLAPRRLLFGLKRFPIPLRVIEMVMGLHEIPNGKIVFPVVEPRPSSDYLLELNHAVYRSKQDDVPDVPSIHTSRKLLRGRQDSRDRFLVVLEVPQVLVPQSTIVRRNSHAIVRIFARLDLIDEVSDQQCVFLSCTEHQSLLVLIDLLHEDLDSFRLTLSNFDGSVEVAFDVPPPFLDIAVNNVVIRRKNVLIDGRSDLLNLERRQEAVVDAVFQRVDVDRLSEILVRIDVILAFRGRRESKLNSR